MGFIGSVFSNDSGSGFKGSSTDIQKPLTEQDARTSQQRVEDSLRQQQEFVNALGAQGGVGNQSNVFNQQQALAGQLGQMAQGEGPNPAQAQLAQTTGQNVANQAALMAGQRGAGANAGLMARQAAQQGAATQQNAVGQAATLRAQQQLAAIQQLQAQQSNMANLSSAQVGQQMGGLQNLNQFQQQERSNVLNGIGSLNNANVSMQSNINNANASIAQGNQATQAGVMGGLANGMSSGSSGGASGGGGGGGGMSSMMGGMMGGYNGGSVKGYDDGGSVTPDMQSAPPSPGIESPLNTPIEPMGAVAGGASGMMPQPGVAQQEGPQSIIGKFLSNNQQTEKQPEQAQVPVQQPNKSNLDKQYDAGYKIGQIPATIFKAIFGMFEEGGQVDATDGMARVPGEAKVAGNSPKNDTVKALLSPGEIVIPRSHANDPEKAAEFARAVVMRQRGRK